MSGGAKSKAKHAASGKPSRTKRRENRRKQRAIRNRDAAAMMQEQEGVYDKALVLCVSCSTECYKVKGHGRKFKCPRCEQVRNMPDLEFSELHFVAAYVGGSVYCWRALQSGNFPAIRYGNGEQYAMYNGDIDTYHEPHFIGWWSAVDKLAKHLGKESLEALNSEHPVYVFNLKFKGVNC